MADTLHFEIVTQVSAVYSATLTSVTLPGAEGEMQILPGHRPLISLISPGSVIAREEGGRERHFAVASGYAEVSNDNVTLIVSECIGAEEIDIETARSQYAELETTFGKANFESEEELEAEAERLERARARIHAFERATGSARK